MKVAYRYFFVERSHPIKIELTVYQILGVIFHPNLKSPLLCYCFQEEEEVDHEVVVAEVDEDEMLRTEISKREKSRLEEMQRLKKQKLHEILDSQNAAIDADMGSNTSKLTEEEEDGLAGETRNTHLLTQPSCKFTLYYVSLWLCLIIEVLEI
ncbi:hypothetical protein ACFE04_013217 [Oxalis oulophora]